MSANRYPVDLGDIDLAAERSGVDEGSAVLAASENRLAASTR